MTGLADLRSHLHYHVWQAPEDEAKLRAAYVRELEYSLVEDRVQAWRG